MTHITDPNKGPGYYSTPRDQWIADECAKADGDRQHSLAHELADIDRLASYANLRNGGNMPRPDYALNAAAVIVVICAAVSLAGMAWAIWTWWM